MTTSTGTRDRILDALRRRLIDKGAAAVTLEAVAADAEVSKGGLLYHFPSKEALLAGLVQRLAEEAESEFEQARQAEGGVVRFYLETSVPDEEEAHLYWSVLAALRTADGSNDEAARLLRGMFEHWSTLLREEVQDPVLAETVRLVGDGLYLSAIAGLPEPSTDLLPGVIDRLLEQVREARCSP